MNTKNIVFLPKLISGILILSNVSCQSHEQKADDAFALVKEEKMMNMDSEEMAPVEKKVELVKKAEPVDEWSLFKSETEKKIILNEKKLRELKNLPNADAKFFKKISGLEQENTDLRRQLNEYAELMKANFEKFKVQMTQNMQAVNSDLNDLSAAGGK